MSATLMETHRLEDKQRHKNFARGASTGNRNKGHARGMPATRKWRPVDPNMRPAKLEFAKEAFDGYDVFVEEDDSGTSGSSEQLYWYDDAGHKRPLDSDDAAGYLHNILDHLLKDVTPAATPEAHLNELFVQDQSEDHLFYALMKTPFNRIYWHIDLINTDCVFVTEVEELAVGSDLLWYSRQEGQEFKHPKAVMDTIRRLVKIASTISHDPEDEYLTELFQEEQAYFEDHGCYPPDY
eukprot:TRINITY_DN98439_c0_g1_i1.p1 TRINITY_DN98439_c0_g1~~TRINITY_DN98439_c0_g1_i1.p1  ORF type:complete len:260 (+),score=49.14 TRINITY_DN98439_c0_g1_i1:69-782(+)